MTDDKEQAADERYRATLMRWAAANATEGASE